MAIYVVYHVYSVTDSLCYKVWRKSQIYKHGNVAVTDIMDSYRLNFCCFTKFLKLKWYIFQNLCHSESGLEVLQFSFQCKIVSQLYLGFCHRKATFTKPTDTDRCISKTNSNSERYKNLDGKKGIEQSANKGIEA